MCELPTATSQETCLTPYAGPGGTTSPSGYQPTPAGYVPDIVKNQTLFVVAANFRL